MNNSEQMYPNFDDILEEYDDHYDLKCLAEQIDELEKTYANRLVLNQRKYRRFLEIYALTMKLCEKIEGTVFQINAEPTIGNNSISFRVPIIDFVGETYQIFQAIIQRGDLFSVDPVVFGEGEEVDSGLEVSICVQGVWQLPA